MQVNVSARCRISRFAHQHPFAGAVVIMFLSCFVGPAAQAQFRASLSGVVSDPTGAVIPGATVTLTNTGTSEKQVSTTADSGIYSFNALPPAKFSLTVERDGFQKKVVDDVQIIPEQPNALNITLQIGEASQTVTVNGSTSQLWTPRPQTTDNQFRRRKSNRCRSINAT